MEPCNNGPEPVVERPGEERRDPNLGPPLDEIDRDGFDSFLYAAKLAYEHREAEAQRASTQARLTRTRIVLDAQDQLDTPEGVARLSGLDAELSPLTTEAEHLLGEYRAATRTFPSRITAFVDDVTADADLSMSEPLGPDIAKLGRALSYSLLINAPGGGAERTCESTPLVLLSDRDDPGYGPLYQYFEAAAELYDGVTPETEARAHVLGKLAELLGALQCMSTHEIVELDATYAASLLDLFDQLTDQRSRQAVRAFWDATLPVTLLLYDAAKYVRAPMTYYVLRYPQTLGFALPEPTLDQPLRRRGFDDTLASALYCAPGGGGVGLTLNRVGMWFDSADEAEPRLGQVVHTGACSLLREMTQLERLGEGDCPMLLFTRHGNSCPGPKTCNPPSRLEGVPAGSLIGPAGDFYAALGERPRARPGMPGSEFTHFGTRRDDATQQGCETPSPPAGGCFVPESGPARPGHLSPDPEVDRLLQCALQVNGPDGVTARSQWMSQPDPACLVGQVRGGGQPSVIGTANDPALNQQATRQKVEEAADVLESAAEKLAHAVSQELRNQGEAALTPQERAGLMRMVSQVAQMARDGQIDFVFTDLPAGTLALFDDAYAAGIAVGSGGRISLNENLRAHIAVFAMVHELMHAAITSFVVGDQMFGSPTLPIGARDLLLEHEIRSSACESNSSRCSPQHRAIRSIGHLCDGSSACDDTCRYIDPKTKALVECLDPAPPPPAPPGNPCANALSCPRDDYVPYYEAVLTQCLSNVDVDVRAIAACAQVLCGTASVAANLAGCCGSGGAGVGGSIGGQPPWCSYVMMDPPPPECTGGGLTDANSPVPAEP